MTKDDIIRMAREACEVAPREDWNSTAWVLSDEGLERFAKLLRNDYSTKHAQLWLKRIDEAVAAEREACAKVCEAHHDYTKAIALNCATAIRARGQA